MDAVATGPDRVKAELPPFGDRLGVADASARTTVPQLTGRTMRWAGSRPRFKGLRA